MTKKPLSDHFNGERFFNPTLTKREEVSFFDGFKVWGQINNAKWPKRVENVARPKLDHKLAAQQVAITFVNHATFLIQLPGLNILTDPVWSERVSPFSFLGPKRVRKPGIDFDQLPKIDLILLSHNHYDHLDSVTLKKLNQKFAPTIFVASGDKVLVESLGFKTVKEFDWWEDVSVDTSLKKKIKITYAPTQHFSSRSLSDRNKSLWGSYMIEFQGKKIYFGGDAGYSKFYKEIQQRLGGTDIALLGIGAYEPNWFMKAMHMNPAEAVRAHIDLQSKLSIGMHFGTFKLSAEDFDQPIRDLKTAMKNEKLNEDAFTIMNEGETRLY